MGFLNPLQARKLPDTAKFTNSVIFSKERIDFLRTSIDNGSLPNKLKTKWNGIAAMPSEYTVTSAFDPWNIPENYGSDGESNREMMEAFHTDTQAACKYAFRYLVNGDPADAQRVVDIVSAFSSIQTFATNAGSLLNWYDGWALLVQAMLMIKGSAASTVTVNNAFKACLNRALAVLEPIAYTRTNNWASWGLSMEFVLALYLQDRSRFDKAIRRWYELFDYSVVSNFLVENGGPANGQRKNNVPWQEIYRMGNLQGNGAYGLLYSAFHLDGMTIAAEYARIGGHWLFDHVSRDGSSLKGLWEEISYQKRNAGPSLSKNYLNVQWYNTSNLEAPTHDYYYSGYYTNRVGGGFYILQELWPQTAASELMNGGFSTLYVAPGEYPPVPGGSQAVVSNGYGILQDYYGMYGADLAYWGRDLYG